MDLVKFFTIIAIGSGTPLGPEHEAGVRPPTLAPADPIDKWERLFAEASRRFDIPAEWIRVVMPAESAGRTRSKDAASSRPLPRWGSCKLSPIPTKTCARHWGLEAIPTIHTTTSSRARRSSWRCTTASYPGLFAAHNAGQSAMTPGLHGTPLPAETRAYRARSAPMLPKAV